MKARLVFLAVLAVFLSASSMSETISTPNWWNTTWHYRVGVDVNTTMYSRSEWPIEVDLNFTNLLAGMGSSGTFGISSTRVVEHNSSGGVMYEIPSQFDAGDGYAAAGNAVGTMVFLLNGTNPQNTKRYFYIYFDIAENGNKPPASYPETLNYSWDGEEFSVNNTYFNWYVDTIRGENTSGLYLAHGLTSPGDIFSTASHDSTTKEYTQFQNGTTPLMFDFRNNATFAKGPLRIVVTQRGSEAYWNDPANKTGEGLMVKKYIFYGNMSWIRVELNYTNTAGSPINRSSTFGGALSFNGLGTGEFQSTVYWGNSTNPASWYGAMIGGWQGMGIVNENQSGTNNFYAANNSPQRFGISLNDTIIPAGQSILQRSAIHFNDTNYYKPLIETFRNNIANPPELTIHPLDLLTFEISAVPNYTIYNRGEAAIVFGNVTLDPYGQVSYVNATLDMGTPVSGDDQTIILYDDGLPAHGDALSGDKIFSNYFNFTETNATGEWNLTVRAYDSEFLFINSSSSKFSLSDQYSVTASIGNPLGISGRIIYADINATNLRNDTYIPGAIVNCTYGAGQLTNITDYGNGTYRLNFTAPLVTGAYTLNCSVSKFNNSGWDLDAFYTESATTSVNIIAIPVSYNASNITWYSPENFTLTINASDTGNASARDTNITLYLPNVAASGTTFRECGDVGIGSYCLRGFNITILNQTVPGTYFINITAAWRNPDASIGESNSTFNITVLSNPKIEVPQAIVSGTVGDGENREVGSFNVTSFGNANASNITFAVSGLPSFTVIFTPVNISAIAPNATSIVKVNVSVPPEYAPGTYNGSINASSTNGGWDNLTLQVIIPPNTTISASASPISYNASNITWYASENFTLTINASDTGNATARYANITLYLPPIAEGPGIYSCGNISVSSSCIAPFNISIKNQAAPGTYFINITAAWRNPDASIGESNSTFNITVLSNPKIEVPQAIVSGTVGDGENREVGSFNVTSFGNANASNITFAVSGLPSFTVIFTPVNISAIAPNATSMVKVNVSVPLRYAAGNYTGTINASAKSGGWDTIVLNVSVPENRSWTRSPPSCVGVEIADLGAVCAISINNTGNAPINFTIEPSYETNHTFLNETNFTLAYAAARYVLVSYNVSGDQKGYYNTTYVIYANTTGTTPENASVDISLYPYLEPFLGTSLSSSSFGENNSVDIYANVTDRSGAGINWTYANVTQPSGRIFASNMTFIGSAGNLTLWKTTFPYNFSDTNTSANATPSANERGIYNISFASADNSGAVGYSASSFKVHRNLTVVLATPFARYPEGDSDCTSGELNYSAKYFGGVPASGVNVTLGILSSGMDWFLAPKNYTTLGGKIYDPSTGQAPEFRACASNAGNYTVVSETFFYDAVSNETVSIQKNTSFEVYPRTLTIELVNPTFESSSLAFRIWVRDIFGTYIAPDNMNISLFRDVFLVNGSVMSILDTSFNMSDSRVVRENTSIGPKYIVSLSGLSTSAAYWIRASASYGGRIGLAEKTFNPGMRTWYDVVLALQEHEVSPGDYLDAELSIDNKAGDGQDVYIEYWVSNAGLEAKSWYSASMHVFVAKDAMVFVPLRAYIFPAQPYGNYWLYARVIPSNDTSGFSWQAHDAFSVVQNPPVPPVYPPPPTGGAITSGGGSGAGTGREKVKAVSIIKYPKNISTVRGWTDISSIEVKNTGELPISNLTLTFTGVPKAWYTLRPNTTQGLSEGNSTVYLLEFKIPLDASPGAYDLVFTARADDVRDEKASQLNIFSSAAEMLLAQINELKSRLANLESETRLAQASGRNTTLVWPALDSARNEIILAEKYVNNASYIDAQNHILIARNFLERAEYLLASSEFIKIVQAKVIPWWLIALVVALAFVASIAMLWTFRLKHRMNVFFKSPALMERVLMRFREDKAERAALIAEREKLARMQNLLEKEVQDGTITQAAYEELNKRTLEKIAALDKKIQG